MLSIVKSLSAFLLFSIVLSLNTPIIQAQISNSTVLFDDNFSNNLDKWRIKFGSWYIDQNALVNKEYGVIDKPSRIETGEENWENFRLEVDLNNLDGIDSGIGFRRNNANNSNYELTIRHGSGESGPGELSTPQILLQKVYWNQPYISIKSTEILGDNRSFPLLRNKWYHIRIEVFKKNIKVWVEDNKLFDITDDNDDIRSGFITLASWTGKLGKIYIAFKDVKVTSLTPIPFLDLPWDYRGQGSNFNYMALDPYSWFDHQFPLQNQCCNWQVMTYTGQTIQRPYRSHNGYDYSQKNGIILNTPVLAAAAGSATFKPWQKSGGAGNVIKIDHGNGYQTWYEHLSSDGLIVSTEGQAVDVEQGQQIGSVGMTGNTDGPHIHFSVFKDSNSDNSFNDEIPYGVTDPLGWDGETDDPWPVWSNGTRSGTPSYNLFSPFSPVKSTSISQGGGILSTEDTNISVPAGAYNGPFVLFYKIGPFESLSDYITGITPSFSLNAYSSGQSIIQFLKPITITINYSKANLINTKENTLKFRRFNEQSKSWEELLTVLDTVNKTISTEVGHLSLFALMGEIKDSVAPATNISLEGDKSQDDWYHSPVKITMTAEDNPGGVGLEYILYTLNNNDWSEYLNPMTLGDEGEHQIIYQAYDKAENQEVSQSNIFRIDKTPPIIAGSFSPTPNSLGWNNTDVTINFDCSDNLSGIDSCPENTIISTEGEGQGVTGTTTDEAGNSASFTVTPINLDKNPPQLTLTAISNGKMYTSNTWTNDDVTVTFDCTDNLSGIESTTSLITVSSEGADQKVSGSCIDKAGNQTTVEFTGINIDKTAPAVTIDINPKTIRPPNGKMVPVNITGTSNDDNLYQTEISIDDEYNQIEPTFMITGSDLGQTIQLEARRKGDDPDGRIYTIEANATDLAGNTTTEQTQILVPHDQSKN